MRFMNVFPLDVQQDWKSMAWYGYSVTLYVCWYDCLHGFVECGNYTMAERALTIAGEVSYNLLLLL